jgi:hypothetical protein
MLLFCLINFKLHQHYLFQMHHNGLAMSSWGFFDLTFQFITDLYFIYYLSNIALLPQLLIAFVVRSVFFFRLDFHSFARNSVNLGKAILFVKFWWCVGWCDLAMCMALSVGLHSI